MRIFDFLRQIKKNLNGHHPLIEIFVSKKHLLTNLHSFQQEFPHHQIAPVLKSNAYGHDLVLTAKILDKEKIAFLVVDSLFEANTLKNAKIKSPILIIGFTRNEDIVANRQKNIAFTITSLNQLKNLTKKLFKPQHFHLKIDTGMHRQGILIKEISEAIQLIKQNPHLILDGLCSHFCNADNENKNYSLYQIENWQKASQLWRQEFPQIKFFHLAATGGSYYTNWTENRTKSPFSENKLAQTTNVIRLGIGLHGFNPSPFAKIKLKPTLEMQTIVTGLKTVEKDEYVGYGITYRANRTTKIATIPAGYFEGIDRRLSNKGYYKIKEQFCPIVGRISMNISLVDVSSLPEIKVGDKVILISRNPKDKNSVLNIAKLCETIPYEILVHIPQHLRRIFF